MLIFPFCLLLIINFLRVSHLPHSLSQNIVQLANLLRSDCGCLFHGLQFMREPDDYIPLKYYFSFNLGLKEAQEHKY